jgi:hypothetical protein
LRYSHFYHSVGQLKTEISEICPTNYITLTPITAGYEKYLYLNQIFVSWCLLSVSPSEWVRMYQIESFTNTATTELLKWQQRNWIDCLLQMELFRLCRTTASLFAKPFKKRKDLNCSPLYHQQSTEFTRRYFGCEMA